MGAFKSLSFALAAGAACLACWRPAAAQCRLCDTPSTAVGSDENGQSIRLEVESRIDFDRLIVTGTGEAIATLRPDGSAVGDVGVVVSPRASVGTIMVHGEPGRAVRVELPSRIVLTSTQGGQIVFENVVSDLPSLPRLDSTGSLSFRLGGRLRVRGDSDGEFRGDLPITVEYL